MTPTWGGEEAVTAFLSAHPSGAGRDFGPCRTIALTHDSALVGGVVLHNWQPDYGTIEISAAALQPGAPLRRVARMIGAYAFDGIACQAVVMRTDESNATARKIAKAAGAAEYLIPRMRGRAASEAIYVITDDAWRQSRWRQT